MSTDKALIVSYFSFFSSRSLGYETQKELRPDYQAFIFDFEHHFKPTSLNGALTYTS